MLRFSSAFCVLAALSISTPRLAHASIAREPLRLVLRQANPDLLACRERHQLEAGRYQVSLIIDPTGKVQRVQLTAGPVSPTPAAESCLAAAFARLHFETGYRPPTTPSETRSGGGRESRVPSGRRVHRPGAIGIAWPFVFAP